MKYFDRTTFTKLNEHNSNDLKLNLFALVQTIETANTPYYSRKFNILLSLAIIPNIIKLIKSAVFFAFALTFCIITAGHFANMNKIALSQFANMFICVGNIALSLVVPFMRNFHSLKQGYSYLRNSDHADGGVDNLRLHTLLKLSTWQNKVTFKDKRIEEFDTHSCPLLSNVERSLLCPK